MLIWCIFVTITFWCFADTINRNWAWRIERGSGRAEDPESQVKSRTGERDTEIQCQCKLYGLFSPIPIHILMDKWIRQTNIDGWILLPSPPVLQLMFLYSWRAWLNSWQRRLMRLRSWILRLWTWRMRCRFSPGSTTMPSK